MASIAELVLLHTGHRLTIVEPTSSSIALKCMTCHGRLTDITRALRTYGQTTSTSTPTAPRHPTPAETCPQHIGEFQGACRCCAADRAALQPGETRISDIRQGADPTKNEAWQAAKAALAKRNATRRQRQHGHPADTTETT